MKGNERNENERRQWELSSGNGGMIISKTNHHPINSKQARSGGIGLSDLTDKRWRVRPIGSQVQLPP